MALPSIKEASQNEWYEFVERGRLRDGTVRNVILDSWRRCRELGVSPYQVKVKKILSDNDFKKRLDDNCQLINISMPVMEYLHEVVAGSGFMVALSDSEGYLLKLIGDSEVDRDAARGNFIPKACWSEESAGTNGVGTVLLEKQPMQIVAREHFCLCSHKWTGSGSPIFGPNDTVIGALIMTGRHELAHPHTLGMVYAGARAIEKQLVLNSAMRSYRVADCYKAVVMNSIYDSLVAVDAKGVITHFNQSAARLFQVDPESVIGYHFEKLFFGEEEREQMVHLIECDEEVTDLEVEIALRSGQKIQCLVTSRDLKVSWEKIGRVLAINEQRRIRRFAQHLAGATARITFDDLLGESRMFKKTIEMARRATGSTSNILLIGESGTGKDMIAQAIHNAGTQAGGPFVAVNCAALPRDLIASELFGYSEGAYTGARKGGNPGKFELADEGTIFLDEIGDMPLTLQTTLLRVIETRSLMRVGGNKEILINVRIIAATNKNLFEEVQRGNFRGDLFYRLNVMLIQIPPLRERPDDIPPMLNHFIKKISSQLGKPPLEIPCTVLEALLKYPWPGNVRQLQNLVERAYNFGQGTMIMPEQISDEVDGESGNISLKELERRLIESLLIQKKHNITSVARTLGVARSTIYKKIQQYGIKA